MACISSGLGSEGSPLAGASIGRATFKKAPGWKYWVSSSWAEVVP